MSLFAFLSWLCRNRCVTRGATPVSPGRGPLNAPPASRLRGTAVHSAATPENTPQAGETPPEGPEVPPTGDSTPTGDRPTGDSMTAGEGTPSGDSRPGDTRTAAIAAGAAAQAPAENFPVALRMLPARYRRHLMAVYRFARTVDDIGDEALPEIGGGQDVVTQ